MRNSWKFLQIIRTFAKWDEKYFRNSIFFFFVATLRVPLNESILHMHISISTTNIGIDQLISSHRPRKLRKSKLYFELTKSKIKTLTPVVYCAVTCLTEKRICLSREKKNGWHDGNTHGEAFNLKFRLRLQPKFKAFLICFMAYILKLSAS